LSVLLVGTSIAVACIEATLVPCGDLACSDGMVCTPGGCATQEDAAACVAVDDGSQCMTDVIGDGTCIGGACRPVVCGNGVMDHNELCDDGNLVPGDGCSLDCLSIEECGNGIIDSAIGEQCDDGGVRGLSGDGCSSTCKLEVDTWRDVTPRVPSPHGAGAIAPDRTGRLVMFGGTSDPLDPYTWQWNGMTWIVRDPPVSPPNRLQFGMAYDWVREQTILFGGGQGINKFADTWAWDGITWKQLTPPTSPPPRSLAQLAYDAEHDRIVLHGGLDINGAMLADTWLWDGSTWTQVFPSTSPGARLGFLLAFHPVWRKVVLYGGTLAGAQQTWSWDGSNWALESVGTPPAGATMMTANDTGLLLHAGLETWQLEATWTKLSVPTTSFISGTLLGHLPTSGTVAFNGTTYRLASAWTAYTPAQTPTLSPSRVAYDARRGRVVAIANGGGSAGGTWEWDGMAWERRDTVRPICEAAVFDSVRSATLCIPNAATSVAAWDGTSWIDPLPASMGPALSYLGFVFDTKRGVALTIGGLTSGTQHSAESWGWNGTVWAQLASLPSATVVPNVTSDPLRDRVYAFGGREGTGSGSAHDHMYELDDNGWTELAPSPRPSARNGAAFVYAPTLQRSILFGGGQNGISGASGFTDTWQWNGSAWSVREPIISPPIGQYVGTTDRFGTLLLLGTDGSTWRFESIAPLTERETCKTVEDLDLDGLSGCADPDCWSRCTPLCPPAVTCPANSPRCGDGTCGPVEDYLICPDDCAS